MEIDRPIIFFEELKIALMTSFDENQQLLILKAMSILYRKSYKQIGEISLIPYLLKLFNQPQYCHLYFHLIQFLLIIVSVEDVKILKKNKKKFVKNNGLEHIFDHIKRALKFG
jgi:hypothetical protein